MQRKVICSTDHEFEGAVLGDIEQWFIFVHIVNHSVNLLRAISFLVWKISPRLDVAQFHFRRHLVLLSEIFILKCLTYKRWLFLHWWLSECLNLCHKHDCSGDPDRGGPDRCDSSGMTILLCAWFLLKLILHKASRPLMTMLLSPEPRVSSSYHAEKTYVGTLLFAKQRRYFSHNFRTAWNETINSLVITWVNIAPPVISQMYTHVVSQCLLTLQNMAESTDIVIGNQTNEQRLISPILRGVWHWEPLNSETITWFDFALRRQQAKKDV